MTKPKTVKQWEKLCSILDVALQSSIGDEQKLLVKIDNLEDKIGKLEEQLIMSKGVIKYLESKIERTKSNPV